jgi:hypothetical protein
MSDLKKIMEKLATGDMIELQIIVLFSGIVIALIAGLFIGRALAQKKPGKPTRMDRKPPKSWKSFCRTK